MLHRQPVHYPFKFFEFSNVVKVQYIFTIVVEKRNSKNVCPMIGKKSIKLCKNVTPKENVSYSGFSKKIAASFPDDRLKC